MEELEDDAVPIVEEGEVITDMVVLGEEEVVNMTIVVDTMEAVD